MDRSDWLILFLAAAPGDPLDPVRVQKGMFLLAMQAPIGDDERYEFEPFAYGPMSRALYGDVRRLSRGQLLDAMPVDGATWRLLQLTPGGAEHAASLHAQAARDQPRALARLTSIRSEISGLGFADLLQHVYDRYPAYAVRSVFRRR